MTMGYLNEGGRTPDWKMRTTLIGSALGAIAGVAAALMFIRRSEETGQPPRLRKTDPGLVLGTGVTLLALLRQIADMGDRK
jgi:branched-subunit amino acid ABC-type transport system permease component